MTGRIDKSGKPTAEALADEKRLQELYPRYRGVDEDYVHAGTEALERWRDWKFGIRIHWSIYSVTGSGAESWPLHSGQNTGGGHYPRHRNESIRIFRQQYEQLYKWWNPCFYDAGEWADLFVRSGLKFFTFTTKHHDGFSMYDTATRVKKRLVHTGSDAGKIVDCDLHYSIMETPFGRDITKELVDACRARGLAIGLYYSHIDWFDCDFRIDEWNYQYDRGYTRESDPEGYKRMIARHREQIRELLTNYGDVDLLSLDMNFPDDGRKHGVRDDTIETIKMARRLQPNLLIRRRGIDPYGDYKTPERVVPTQPDAEGGGVDMPWQVIYPASSHFSHVWHDEYKPPKWVIDNLVDITAKGGCFQVGYGPMPNGRWPDQMVRTMETVGDWLKINGEGIYGTRPYTVFSEGDHIRFTRTKDRSHVYAFVLNWPERPVQTASISLRSVKAKSGSKITMLGTDHAFDYTQNGDELRIEIPEGLRDADRLPCAMAQAFKIEV
ncbi:MAG: hypothetical protein GF418_03160 [Chitinivibrionales bacterium]|nr:hypothetical protein [Chitinivibrionales bacterium]MBD3394601.1 hypothetical protein [Chitinivibrionales bacterium]